MRLLVKVCLTLATLSMSPLGAQTHRSTGGISLDSCRALALRHNKSIGIARLEVERAQHLHKAAKTNYLPKLSATAAYTHLGRSLSLLSDQQQEALASFGTGLTGAIAPGLASAASSIIAANPGLAPLITSIQSSMPAVAQALNHAGQRVADALSPDTRDLAVGAILLTQPLYMGGKIRAYDRLTHYSERLAGERLRAEQQDIILEVDKAYWQVISLTNKQRLAGAYRDMLVHLEGDIQKMMAEGVATRAALLSVSVELNKAEMSLAKVEDGLTLSRMLLAQLCGWPLEDKRPLADELLEELSIAPQGELPPQAADGQQRPELEQLRLASEIYREKVKIERAEALPSLALTAGAITHYPSLYQGFEKKLGANWNVALALKVPLWRWGETRHKITAARREAEIAKLRLEEAQERITLQVRQTTLAVQEANRKLALSIKGLAKAEEHLRTARLGFEEGLITTSDLLSAQTAWLAAQSEKIDAQIDVMLSLASYRKAIGL